MNTSTTAYTRTRIAPTPSGYLHLGNVLSFAVTATLAQKHQAKILLRIDDLDRARIRPQYVQDIFDTLNFMELPWHEGPRNYREYEQEYSQLRRLSLYHKALRELRNAGDLFACTCTRAQIVANGGGSDLYPGTCRNLDLPFEAPDTCWRLRTEIHRPLNVHQPNGEIITADLPITIGDFVVRKKDGYPAYQLASVIDDLHFGVDLVVRGQDLWASTLAQLYLAGKLHNNAFARTAFFHHPLLMQGADRKLSKSAGDTSVMHLRQQGKTAAYIYTLIAQMLGIAEPAADWQSLISLMEGKQLL